MRPWGLRPARCRPLATSDFSGRSRVISSNPDTLEPRRPGVVGLYFLTAIGSPGLEDLDLVTRGEGDDGALLIRALALDETLPLDLTSTRQRVDAEHVHVPDRSEEHTSELQSQFHLVCRLLLEKKKKLVTPALSLTFPALIPPALDADHLLYPVSIE